MKPRLLFSLMFCALLLTACYRQTEESFQQADSAEAVVLASPTSPPADVAGDSAEGQAGTPPAYLTPEAAPGQVQQPTADRATQVIIAATPHSQTLTPFSRPTATVSFEEELDAAHECVYTVVAGDNLYRISLAWNTTVQVIMDVNQLDSDALSIGQLLLRPGCEYATATASPPVSPAPVVIEPAADDAAAPEQATDVLLAATATPLPNVHVVSAGDTVESIALKYRVDVNALISLNNIANPNQIVVGQELRLPE